MKPDAAQYQRISSRGLCALLLLAVLAACAPGSTFPPDAASTATAKPSPAATHTPQPSLTPTITASLTPTWTSSPTSKPTLTFTPSLSPTATKDTRLDPVKWMDWPVVPLVSGRAKAIYQKGLALGNNPKAFSKVADCQGIKEVLLGNFEKPGWYKLTGENLPLQQTIDAFPGSFNRNGMAVLGGYNARNVLSAQHADPAYCLPGESPVECEFRVHQPSIAIISLEVFYDGRTVENYTQYMRQIIDFFIRRGVLPILATKADNKEGDHRYNLTTARLAYEYDLPLWNWWRAAQALPNKGMDLSWSDGFHISPIAWNERSLTALQALDAVWRAVKDLPAAAAVKPTALPTLKTPTPRSAVQQPSAGGARIIFGAAQRKDVANLPEGVFLYEVETGQTRQIAGAGFELQAVAPDGSRVLINRGAELFSAQVDGLSLMRVADDFYALGWPLAGADWLADGSRLIYLANRGGEPGIFSAAPDGTSPRRLTGEGALPIGLLPSADASRVYWQSGVCRAAGDCVRQAAFSSTLEGKVDRKWDGMLAPEFTGKSRSAAYGVFNTKGELNLSMSMEGREFIWTPQLSGQVVDYDWSPGGNWLVELLMERDSYTGKVKGPRVFLFNNATYQSVEWASANLLGALAAWSPAGDALLVAGTEPAAAGNRLWLRVMEFPGGKVKSTADGKIGAISAEFPFFTRVEWLP